MEERMKKNEPTQIQISTWVMKNDLRRAEALVPKLAKHPLVAATGKVTRSTVLRLAITRGLDTLEKEHK
jgi:hypothetical protein